MKLTLVPHTSDLASARIWLCASETTTAPPPIDDAVDAELCEWIERRKASFPDSNV